MAVWPAQLAEQWIELGLGVSLAAPASAAERREADSGPRCRHHPRDQKGSWMPFLCAPNGKPLTLRTVNSNHETLVLNQLHEKPILDTNDMSEKRKTESQ